MNTTRPVHAPYPQVKPPAGAVTVRFWVNVGPGLVLRYWEAKHHVVKRDPRDGGDIHVYLCGTQHVDGTVEPEIVVHRCHRDQPITTVAQARQLGRVIMSAARDLEELQR